MRVVTYYYSFDDVEFYTMEECLEHEQFARDMVEELLTCYEPCNGADPIVIDITKELEEILDDMGNAFSSCDYINVHRLPSSSADTFQINTWGYVLPEEIGRFWYDMNRAEWTKVD